MAYEDRLIALIAADAGRMRPLGLVRSLGLPDCWIGAGFVRSAVWDALHGRPASHPTGDVDVVWFDPARSTAAIDLELESELHRLDPSIGWSVKNQSRMHVRNGDRAYASTEDAMRFWPETATAVGVRLDEADGIEVAAPYGLNDLFDLVVRPTECFRIEKRAIFLERVTGKRWLEVWPKLRIDPAR